MRLEKTPRVFSQGDLDRRAAMKVGSGVVLMGVLSGCDSEPSPAVDDRIAGEEAGEVAGEVRDRNGAHRHGS